LWDSDLFLTYFKTVFYDDFGLVAVLLDPDTEIMTNLGLIMRQLVGHGTPRGLRGCLSAVIRLLATLVGLRDPHWTTFAGRETFERPVPVYSTDTIEIPLFA
jgi:hypothetical protein